VEEKHDWSCIAKSNTTLRNTALQKLADIRTVDLQLKGIQ